jgi:hypothetical protein
MPMGCAVTFHSFKTSTGAPSIHSERHNVRFIIDVSFTVILIDDSLQMLHTTDVRLSLVRVSRKVLEVSAACGV